jgi:hypothetical protein
VLPVLVADVSLVCVDVVPVRVVMLVGLNVVTVFDVTVKLKRVFDVLLVSVNVLAVVVV